MSAKKVGNSKRKVVIYNKINSGFRQIHVDGALGGLTPKGIINLNFYSERFPIPKSTEFELNNNTHSLTKLKDSEDSKQGVIREYEFGIYLDVDTAKGVVDWLNLKIKEYQKINRVQTMTVIKNNIGYTNTIEVCQSNFINLINGFDYSSNPYTPMGFHKDQENSDLVKLCMEVASISFSEDWEDENDDHWASFLK